MANMLQNIQGMQPQIPQGTWYGGRPAYTEQQSIVSPQFQGLQNQSIQQLMQMIQQGNQGKYEGFEPIAQEARENFATQTVPGLAERFTSLGTQRSGAYKNAMQSAGSQFERGLAGLKSQYGMENERLQQGKFGQLSNLASQQNVQNNYIPRQPGIPEQILPGLAALAPVIGSAFGPIGTGVGAGVAGLSQLAQWLINRGQGQSTPQSPESVPQELQQQIASRQGNYQQSAMTPNLNTLSQAVPQQNGMPQGINLGTLSQLQLQQPGINYTGPQYNPQQLRQQNLEIQRQDLVSALKPEIFQWMKDIGEGKRYKTQSA